MTEMEKRRYRYEKKRKCATKHSGRSLSKRRRRRTISKTEFTVDRLVGAGQGMPTQVADSQETMMVTVTAQGHAESGVGDGDSSIG